MENMQEHGHPEGYDYDYGSPHLKHAHLRTMIEDALVASVSRIIARTGKCSALEVGGGHGAFSGVLLAAGAEVTITEMSEPSAAQLEARFREDPRVTVVYDPSGAWLSETSQAFDLVAFISVLHHIPDYESAIRRAITHVRAGGEFQSWQDPPYYPTMRRRDRWAMHLSYFAWRMRQGSLTQGVKTRLRRIRGVLDQANPADMVEYHVVRQGVDELLLQRLLSEAFDEVTLIRYWSAQGGASQRWGTRAGFTSSFGLIGRSRK
jgi:SAM-dependent methyltransferase